MLDLDVRAARGEVRLDVALTVPSSTCTALTGPSGAGKTSLLRAISGLLRPASGHIECAGEIWFDSASARNLRPEQRRCGVVFQDYALFPQMSVWRNVAYGMRYTPRAQRRKQALELLDRFSLTGLSEASPRDISGGERQRVALARALALRPSALLLDEPLSALDRASAATASRELSAVLRDAGMPCVLVTHDFAQASLLADAIAVIDEGSIVQRGTAAELSARPANSFVAELTGASVLRGLARERGGGTTTLTLTGGATVVVAGASRGPASLVLRPWDVTLEAVSPIPRDSSARNRVRARISGLVPLGDRVRVALTMPDALIAEVTSEASEALALQPGMEVDATWKATTGRLIAGPHPAGTNDEDLETG